MGINNSVQIGTTRTTWYENVRPRWLGCNYMSS